MGASRSKPGKFYAATKQAGMKIPPVRMAGDAIKQKQSEKQPQQQSQPDPERSADDQYANMRYRWTKLKDPEASASYGTEGPGSGVKTFSNMFTMPFRMMFDRRKDYIGFSESEEEARKKDPNAEIRYLAHYKKDAPEN